MTQRQRVAFVLAAPVLALAGPLLPVFFEDGAWAQPGKHAVMILGTMHFEGSGADLASSPTPDVLGSKRQREIADVVVRVAEWRPTVVAVEAMPGDKAVLDRWARFRDETLPLGANEIEQLGFQIAKRSGLRTLCLADANGAGHPDGMTVKALFDEAEASGQTALVDALKASSAAHQRFLEEAAMKATVGQTIAALNTPSATRINGQVYNRWGDLLLNAKWNGADWVGNYWARNIRIHNNLRRCLIGPRERLLVIFGSGHRSFLTTLMQNEPEIRLVDPLRFLPAPTKIPHDAPLP